MRSVIVGRIRRTFTNRNHGREQYRDERATRKSQRGAAKRDIIVAISAMSFGPVGLFTSHLITCTAERNYRSSKVQEGDYTIICARVLVLGVGMQYIHG